MKRIICAFLILNAMTVYADTRLISVTGSAERSVEPDMAKVLVSVWGKAETAKSAQNLSSEQNDNFKKVLEQFNVKKSDTMTTGYDLSPEYTYDKKDNANKVTGYTASQSVRVLLKKTDIVGKFMDALIRENNKNEKNIKSGTSIQGVVWDVEKRDEIEKSLMTDAVKNAEDQALLLAKAARVKVKNVFHLVPQNFSQPAPMYDAAPMMMKSEAVGAARETSVFAGEIKIKAQVSADYEIE
jgi:uncharacterized protein YggE